jgi:hypothetical protein
VLAAAAAAAVLGAAVCQGDASTLQACPLLSCLCRMQLQLRQQLGHKFVCPGECVHRLRVRASQPCVL